MKLSISIFIYSTAASCALLISTAVFSQRHPAVPVSFFSKDQSAQLLTERAFTGIQFKNIKAVLIAGDVDGKNGKRTKENIRNMKHLAGQLGELNIRTSEFYAPENNWKDIKKEIQNSHFLIYTGHGVGNTDPLTYKSTRVGGFYLKDKEYVSNQEIENLKVIPGSIAIFIGACFSAGNSSTDLGKIKYDEALNRVLAYSEPFMKAGFSGYYSTWSSNTASNIIITLLRGTDLKESYRLSENNAKTHTYEHNSIMYFINEDHWDKTGTVFNYTFAGYPEKKLASLYPENIESESFVFQVENQGANRRLLRAAYNGNQMNAEGAIASGGDVNSRDNDGWTPILLASYFGHANVVKLLIKKGADINASVNGWNSLQLAGKKNHNEVENILREAGASQLAMRSLDEPPRPGTQE